MNFLEHTAKSLVLKPAGIPVSPGVACKTGAEAKAAFAKIGPCVVKAQVPTGKRGKAGGIKTADSAEEAEARAADILKLTIDGHPVREVLIEAKGQIERELYAAVLNDFAAKKPLVLFSTEGGMDIEETAARDASAVRRHHVDLDTGFDAPAARALLTGANLGAAEDQVADILVRLYQAFMARDAELVEINPLAVLKGGKVVALDCKLTLDDASLYRQPELAPFGAPEKLTDLETKAAAAGLKLIDLGGNVGVLANGAGLTMTTMDVVSFLGGKPADFLEIGGEAYTKAETALGLVLSIPGVKSVVVNFCGAFARTDVMADGVVKAIKALKPSVPFYFSIHGTGEAEARALVERELGLKPLPRMEDAITAAIKAAGGPK